jgi:hypothetical protein
MMPSNSKSNENVMGKPATNTRMASAASMFHASAQNLQASAQGWMKQMEQGEVALRAILLSCTSGAKGAVSDDDVPHSEKAKDGDNANITTTRNTDLDPANAVYAQLFFDDQIRAAKAVNNVIHDPALTADPRKHRSLSRPFPSTAPHATSRSLPTNPGLIEASGTFDDCISAISAHTLEAMVQFHPVELPKQSSAMGNKAIVSSVPFDRSHPSTDTKHTASTRSTESSSFDCWQRNEQKYWENKQHGKKYKHPHDTISFGIVADTRPISNHEGEI